MELNKLKKSIVITCGVLVTALLSGCAEEVKTRDWYMDHPKELADVYAKCKASGNDTPNCRNAIEAQFQIQQKNAAVPSFKSRSPEEIQADLKKYREKYNDKQ